MVGGFNGCVYIILPFIVLALGGRPGQLRTEAAQSNLSSVAGQFSTTSTWKSYGARAASMQRLRREGAMTVQPHAVFQRFLPPCSPKNRAFAAHDQREASVAMPLRGLCSATYDIYMYVYGLAIFSNLYNFLRNKIIIKRPQSLWIHTKISSRLLPSHGGHTEKGIRAGYRLRRLIAGQM